MKMSITSHKWVPISFFRQQYALPDDFSVAMFAPRNYTPPGSIDRAGSALNMVHYAMLDAIPGERPSQGWLAFGLELQRYFTRLLWRINPLVCLRASEIEFAAAGFGEVLQAYLYEVQKTQMRGYPLPDFFTIYSHWLEEAVVFSARKYPYTHQGATWQVQLIQTRFGVGGLRVEMPDEEVFVRDTVYVCPAEGFMGRLLSACAQRIHDAIVESQAT
ncbi:MAG: hypothetical protein OHK0046_16880 [Anaerolineae bacterium]